MMGSGFGEAVGARLVRALLIGGAVVLAVGVGVGAVVARAFR